MKRASLLPLGQKALGWVRKGGRPFRGGLARSWLYRWHAFWFERNLALQSSLHGAVPIPEAPLFVMGMWRSGTTLLHTLLSQCPGLITPSTWQCMNPSTFRLQGPPARGGTVERPMDRVAVEAQSPQEDEFALLALGAPSLYRAFFDPRRLGELSQWLNPDFWTTARAAEWQDDWYTFLGGVVAGREGRLLLKSPPHTFRVKLLTQLFPRAAYVWIVRDPRDVFLSNRKMWTAMFEQYALWDWEPTQLDAFLLASMHYAGECIQFATDTFKLDQLVVVEFESLVESECEVLEGINRRLHIGDWSAMKQPIAAVVAKSANYRREDYLDLTADSQVQEATSRLAAIQRAALDSHGL